MRRALLLVAAAPFLVLASSWVGLNLYPTLAEQEDRPHDSVAFFREVWSDSLAADVVFVVGTLAAAALTYAAARRTSPLVVAALGFAAQWATYLASYLLLSTEVRPEGESLWEAVHLVANWGLAGLLLAAIVPIALARPSFGLADILAGIVAVVFILASGAYALMATPSEDLAGPLALVWSAATPILLLGSAAAAIPVVRRARNAGVGEAMALGPVLAALHVFVLVAALALAADPAQGAPRDVLPAALTGWGGLLAAAFAPFVVSRWAPDRREGAPAA